MVYGIRCLVPHHWKSPNGLERSRKVWASSPPGERSACALSFARFSDSDPLLTRAQNFFSLVYIVSRHVPPQLIIPTDIRYVHTPFFCLFIPQNGIVWFAG